MKLWEITDELAAIRSDIIEAGGEIDEDTEARLEAWDEAFESKVESVAFVVRQAEADAEAAKSEEQRLAAIRKAHERTAQGLKDYLLGCLERADVERVETPRARVRRQRSGTPKIEYHGEVEALPDEYVRVVPERRELDKKAITELVRAGEDPPEGVTVSYSEHVRIT